MLTFSQAKQQETVFTYKPSGRRAIRIVASVIFSNFLFSYATQVLGTLVVRAICPLDKFGHKPLIYFSIANKKIVGCGCYLAEGNEYTLIRV